MLIQSGALAAASAFRTPLRAMDQFFAAGGVEAGAQRDGFTDTLPIRSALIVDDESLIAMAIAEYCRDLGAEAIAVFDPLQALEILGQRPEIEVLITDVRMPGMNGPELMRRARAARPDLAVLFITGFAAEGDLADAGDWPVLRKPFDLGALGPALRRALALR